MALFCFHGAGTVDLPFNSEPIVIKQILNFTIFIYTFSSKRVLVQRGVKWHLGWQWCWWQRYVGNLMMVQDDSPWNDYDPSYFWQIMQICLSGSSSSSHINSQNSFTECDSKSLCVAQKLFFGTKFREISKNTKSQNRNMVWFWILDLIWFG